jgi:outer membrane receptor protein involved in Fe transport
MLTSANRMFLDDANQQKIADWKRWDLRAAYERGEFQVTADLINLADSEYSTTGFPDPSGYAAAYYYPAAGRSLHIGLNWRRQQ